MNEVVMVRPKRNEHSGKGVAGFAVYKRDKAPDLTDFVFLKETGGADEYVHKDDYEFYSKFLANS